MVDVASGIGKGDMFILESLKNNDVPVILVLNKIDEITSKDESFSIANRLSDTFVIFNKSEFLVLGGFDKKYEKRILLYDDLCMKYNEANYKVVICNNSFVPRKIVNTMSNEEYKYYYNLYKEYFFSKWGINYDYDFNCRIELLDLLDISENRGEVKVLEVGCSSGETLLEFKNRYKDSKFYGIDINENMKKVISDEINFVVGDAIEKVDMYKSEYFDYIILGDVIEHLPNPEKLLMMVKDKLKKSGKIVLSVPNISHYSVIREIIDGDFKYEEYGILDKTHLRFFTLKSIKRLLSKCGIGIEKVTSNVQYKEEDNDFIDKLMSISKETSIDNYVSYQYFFVLTK